MKTTARVLKLGLLVWLVPFVVGVLAFSIHESARPLFESIMAVTVSGTAVYFGVRYFAAVSQPHIAHGWFVGIVWCAMCVAIDLPLFLFGPMKRPLLDYMADIGLTYVAIPLIVAGLAIAQRRGARQVLETSLPSSRAESL